MLIAILSNKFAAINQNAQREVSSILLAPPACLLFPNLRLIRLHIFFTSIFFKEWSKRLKGSRRMPSSLTSHLSTFLLLPSLCLSAGPFHLGLCIGSTSLPSVWLSVFIFLFSFCLAVTDMKSFHIRVSRFWSPSQRMRGTAIRPSRGPFVLEHLRWMESWTFREPVFSSKSTLCSSPTTKEPKQVSSDWQRQLMVGRRIWIPHSLGLWSRPARHFLSSQPRRLNKRTRNAS